MTKQPKFAKSAAELKSENGDITFVAARNVENLNGYTYDIKSLQAQNSAGDYVALSTEDTEVAIPLMEDHGSSVKQKVGNIDRAKIENVDGIDQVVMHATFFKSEEAQTIRQRVLDNELTDVSITTDWGSDEDAWLTGNLENSRIIEVSVVYAGAEPKAKILAKNSLDTEDEEAKAKAEADELAKSEAEAKAAAEEAEKLEQEKLANEAKAKADAEAAAKLEEEEAEMPKQDTPATNDAAERVADKAMVLNALTKLAQSDAIRKMNRSQVIEAVRNEINLEDADGDPYVVPDAIFTEILAVTRPTDILETFRTIPAKKYTEMGEVPSDEDLARAGRWSKGDQKQIQESDLKAQKFSTQFLYKLQELSYEDMQEEFGELLYSFIRQELPQKAAEEEERDFIVGDGRATNAPRHISSIVSFKDAAADSGNVHVAAYDGSGDSSVMEAILKGIELIEEDGTLHLVARKDTLGALRRTGLDTAAGLPFTNAQVADALDVDGLHKRAYVEANVAYVWVENKTVRLNPRAAGETIEQYDIDFNNQKIEYIRPVGGGATGLYSAVRIVLPVPASA